MAPPLQPTFATRLKVQLKLSIARLRTMQARDDSQSRAQRRQLATLLEAGKIESARVRAEGVVRLDVSVELYELLELFCELLLARAPLVDSSTSPANAASSSSSAVAGKGTGSFSFSAAGKFKGGGDRDARRLSCGNGLDPGLHEAVATIIYAAPRTEVRELLSVRALLVDRVGKEFAARAMENLPWEDADAGPEDSAPATVVMAKTGGAKTKKAQSPCGMVNEKVLRKLSVQPPRKELVDGYLAEIAAFYGVAWPPQRRIGAGCGVDDDEDEDEDGTGEDDSDDGDEQEEEKEEEEEEEEQTRSGRRQKHKKSQKRKKEVDLLGDFEGEVEEKGEQPAAERKGPASLALQSLHYPDDDGAPTENKPGTHDNNLDNDNVDDDIEPRKGQKTSDLALVTPLSPTTQTTSVVITTPKPSADNVRPQATLDDAELDVPITKTSSKKSKESRKEKKDKKKDRKPETTISDAEAQLDELAKRFAALKQ